MSEKYSDSPPQIKPRTLFFLVFIILFTLVFAASMIRNGFKPKSYAGIVRVEVKPREMESKLTRPAKKTFSPLLEQTEISVIQSEVVLNKAIWNLNLNTVWGNKYFNGETLKTWESAQILKGRLDVRPIPNPTISY